MLNPTSERLIERLASLQGTLEGDEISMNRLASITTLSERFDKGIGLPFDVTFSDKFVASLRHFSKALKKMNKNTSAKQIKFLPSGYLN